MVLALALALARVRVRVLALALALALVRVRVRVLARARACVVIQSSKPALVGDDTDHFSGDMPGSFLSQRSPRCHLPSCVVACAARQY